MSRAKQTVKYLLTILKHKFFVVVAGRRVGNIPLLRLLRHDNSKFSKEEFGPYRRRFYAAKGEDRDGVEWASAWKHHLDKNPHHWEFWVGLSSNDTPCRMPEVVVREMVADWMAASKAYSGSWDMTGWIETHYSKLNLHPETDKYLRRLLVGLGYAVIA